MSFGGIFDRDGVIIDPSAQPERAWERLAAEEDSRLPAGHFKRGFGQENEKIIPDFGGARPPAEVARLGGRKEELDRELLQVDGVAPLPGARALLEAAEASLEELTVGRLRGLLDARERFTPEPVTQRFESLNR